MKIKSIAILALIGALASINEEAGAVQLTTVEDADPKKETKKGKKAKKSKSKAPKTDIKEVLEKKPKQKKEPESQEEIQRK